MKHILSMIMICSGFCWAGDFAREIQQPQVIIQQQFVAQVMALNVVAGGDVVRIEPKKRRYERNPKPEKNIQRVPKNQKYSKQKNIYRKTNR